MIRSRWYAHSARLFQRFDAVVLPTAQVWPFPADWRWPQQIAGRAMDTYHRWMEVVVPASLIGLPALSVPVGFSPAGLPMGMQIIGRAGDDAGVRRSARPITTRPEWRGAGRQGWHRRGRRGSGRFVVAAARAAEVALPQHHVAHIPRPGGEGGFGHGAFQRRGGGAFQRGKASKRHVRREFAGFGRKAGAAGGLFGAACRCMSGSEGEGWRGQTGDGHRQRGQGPATAGETAPGAGRRRPRVRPEAPRAGSRPERPASGVVVPGPPGAAGAAGIAARPARCGRHRAGRAPGRRGSSGGKLVQSVHDLGP